MFKSARRLLSLGHRTTHGTEPTLGSILWRCGTRGLLSLGLDIGINGCSLKTRGGSASRWIEDNESLTPNH